MGKREGYRTHSNYCVHQYQAAPTDDDVWWKKKKKTGSPCMQRFSRNRTSRGVGQLEVAWWEKQFCLEVGLFTWKDFLEAKKYSQYYATSKIQNWDDSAAEEAFHLAKTRFYARSGHIHYHDQSMMDPDLYIDQINWDDADEVDLDLLEELESAKLPKDYHVPHDPIEDIKPTGWDVDTQELSQSNVLTGLIVGY